MKNRSKLRSSFNHNLFQEIASHRLAYLFLIIFLSAVVGIFTWAGYDILWQRLVILFLGVGYFLWGVITHLGSKTLSFRLIFEYAAISILASVCLIALTI